MLTLSIMVIVDNLVDCWCIGATRRNIIKIFKQISIKSGIKSRILKLVNLEPKHPCICGVEDLVGIAFLDLDICG